MDGFSFGTFALSTFAAIKYGFQWAFVCLLIGFAEELEYRGYAQFTLTTGMGFWPSALVMSALFGVNHLSNLHESWVGALECLMVGLFWCFTLRRTGNLWFAVGMHAAGDFAETFLYSVPNSGLRATGTLLNSSVHGPRWLTGGAVGPEGSVVSFVLLGLSFFVFDKLHPARDEEASSPPATLSDTPSLQAS